MPMVSEAQRRLMQGIKHGWKPSRMKNPPSRKVAREFVKEGMKEGVVKKQFGGFMGIPATGAYPRPGLTGLSAPAQVGPSPSDEDYQKYQSAMAIANAPAEATNLFSPGAREDLGQVGGLEAIQQRYMAPSPRQATVQPGREFVGAEPQPLGGVRTPSSLLQYLEHMRAKNAARYEEPQGLQYGGVPRPVGMAGPSRFPPQGAPRRPGVIPGRQFIGAGGEGAGIPGGPQIPPNLRGYLQQMRMQNRQSPAGAGGGPRIGGGDQRGVMARARQSQTGRPPISRRSAFPGRAR